MTLLPRPDKMIDQSFKKNEFIDLMWDTDFFGITIGRMYASGIGDMDLAKELGNASKRKVAFVELFCDSSDELSVYAAEKSGFHLGDLRISLRKNLDGDAIGMLVPGNLIFKKADREDALKLKSVCQGVFKHSRYYRYRKFDSGRVDLMFQTWVEKSICGQLDDELYFLCDDADVLAFCTLKYTGDEASIGLFMVDLSHQGQGLGSLMLKRVFQLLHQRRSSGLNITTQGNNIGALHLYQKNGFLISKMVLSYYKWLS